MPVILSPIEYDTWLDREVDDPAKLRPLFQPIPGELMKFHSVSSVVNSPRHEGEDCIRPEKSY